MSFNTTFNQNNANVINASNGSPARRPASRASAAKRRVHAAAANREAMLEARVMAMKLPTRLECPASVNSDASEALSSHMLATVAPAFQNVPLLFVREELATISPKYVIILLCGVPPFDIF